MKNIPQSDSWHSGLFTTFDVANALGASATSLAALLECGMLKSARQAARASKAEHFVLDPGSRASLAIMHALHSHAALDVTLAEQALSSWPTIALSVASLVDFQPDASNDDGACLEPESTADPFQFYGPHAGEPLPVAMLDDYIDVIDGRYLLWRRPKEDPQGLASVLHASQQRLRLDPHDVAAQADFLAAAAVVRRSPEHQSIWLGSIRDGRFCPVSSTRDARPCERLPTAPKIDEPGSLATLATNYCSKHSVNISHAARSMKRRALGLTVR